MQLCNTDNVRVDGLKATACLCPVPSIIHVFHTFSVYTVFSALLESLIYWLYTN